MNRRLRPLLFCLAAATLACNTAGEGEPRKDKGRERTTKPLKKADGEEKAPEDRAAAALKAQGPKAFVLDQAYAAQHEYQMPASIEFSVDATNLRETSPPAEQRVYLRLDRTTADGKASEDLMFTSLQIPPGEPGQRLDFAKDIIEKQGLARMMPEGATILNVQKGEVAGLPAAVGTGEFQAQNSGKVHAAMVAVVLPGADCFTIMSHHVVDNSPVKTPEDVTTKGLLAEVLKSLKVTPNEG